MQVDSKTIVVTGAGGGIGGRLALELLIRGARVAAVDLKKESLLKTEDQAGNLADKMSTHALDITNVQSVAELPQKIVNAHGQVDGLINCAGIIQPFLKINDLGYDAINKVMNVNFYGTLYMTKAFLPILLERPKAHIANVSSMGGFLPVPGQAVYGASKAAVKLLTEGLYAELKNTNVGVSCVFPGATQTNITKNSGVEAPVSGEEAKNYPALSASRAAKIIIDGIEKNKPLIYTGKDSKTMNALYRLNPVFATNYISNKMKNLLTN